MIRVLLVDDKASIREEMRRLLELEEDIQVIGEAADGWEAIKRARTLQPDLILMDKAMPSLDGIEATRLIKKDHPQARIIFLAAEDTWRAQALAAGAEAYFLKEESPGELIKALREGNGLRREVAINLSLLGRRLRATIDSVPRQKSILMGAPLALLLAGFAILGGQVLALIGLTLGVSFFAYALKYYASIALILLFNGENGLVNGNGHVEDKGLRNGLQNGLRKIFGNGVDYAFANGYRIEPGVQPFVSIHLPLYNEKEVVDRLLTASTSLDYENYEVIVADDSTDETTKILERWAEHPRVKISHRQDRSGFKGGALQVALQRMDPRTEFVIVFDADFIPPPDVITRFLAYFYSGNGDGQRYADDRVAVVQGYQWHMLNASQNWITRGIRVEFSGSYVIERPGQELLGSMKMISGSVFMIRADVLRKHGWGTSITEDWELTLRLYLDGYKVLYTPFIQAPAECISDFRQLTRQRMRWAEGHTYNVKKYFWKVLRSPHISLREKAEFLYYAPYYLQSIFFILGTSCWFISELILHSHIPYWTALLGWCLVFSNLFSLVIMNLSGLFLERGVHRNWSGIFSFLVLSNLLVPFQAYAALKGLLEKDEGGWHRTPKSGRITEILGRLRFGKKLRRLLPKGKKSRLPERAPALVRQMPIEELGLSTRVFNRLKSAGITQVGEVLERLRRGDEALLTIRRFGPRSLEEVQTALQVTPIDKLDLSERLVKALRRARVSQIGKLLARMEKGEGSLISIKGIGPASLEQMKSALDQAPLEILGLSTRVHNCLKDAETTTLGQLLQRMENGQMALLSIHNFGPKSLEQLKKALTQKAILSPLDHPRESQQKEDAGSTLKLSRWLSLPKRPRFRPAFTAIIVLVAAIVALAIMSTEVEAVADNSSTFWFYDDTNPLTYMMYQSQPSGGSTNTQQDVSFYSDTFEASQSLESGTAMVYIYATNSAGGDKSIDFTLRVGAMVLGTGSVAVPGKTTSPLLLTTSFPTSTYDFADGERLVLDVESVGAVVVYWDGDYNDSRLVTATIVPEGVLGLLLLAPFIPLFMILIKRSRGIRSRERRRAGC
ncbi:MAG: DNA-directed RNA polymerase subunit alpha C-terminal domain-containing protein [Anaerolineae bacterium]